MKATYHPNTELLYLIANTPDELVVLGRLRERIKGAQIYSGEGTTTKELSCNMAALIEAVLE